MEILKSPFDSRDFKFGNFVEEVYNSDVCDNSNRIYLPLDQGKSSMCMAYACAAMKSFHELVDTGSYIKFSHDFIYDKRISEVGMYGRTAMKILHEIGCIPTKHQHKSDEEKNKIAENYKIDGYALVEHIEDLKKAIYLNNCALLVSSCYNSDADFWKKKNDKQVKSGHATLIVGYDKNGIIIRNSWGPRWNGNGHTWMSYNDFNKYMQDGTIWEIWTTVDAKSIKRVEDAEDNWQKINAETIELTSQKKKCCIIC